MHLLPDTIGELGPASKTVTVSPGYCTVPSLNQMRFNDANAIWQGAPYNFTGTVKRATGAPSGNFKITAQSIAAGNGATALCSSDVYVKLAVNRLRHLHQPRMAGRRGHGQSLVEFALVLPVFILVLVSLFDLGRAVFVYNTLTNAAREGARLAIVNQDVPTDHRPEAKSPDRHRRG